MTIIYVLIPVGLLLLGLGIWAFFWASGSGQYDDLESPAWRILMDDDSRPPRPDDQRGEAADRRGAGDDSPPSR